MTVIYCYEKECIHNVKGICDKMSICLLESAVCKDKGKDEDINDY